MPPTKIPEHGNCWTYMTFWLLIFNINDQDHTLIFHEPKSEESSQRDWIDLVPYRQSLELTLTPTESPHASDIRDKQLLVKLSRNISRQLGFNQSTRRLA